MKGLAVRMRADDGLGIVTALVVSLIVASFGATWYALGVHELDEVNYDASRTGAVNMADVGAREAMYLLANDSMVRAAALAPGACHGLSDWLDVGSQGHRCTNRRNGASGGRVLVSSGQGRSR